MNKGEEEKEKENKEDEKEEEIKTAALGAQQKLGFGHSCSWLLPGGPL